MDIHDRLEAALDLLLCDADELTEDVEAKERAARNATDTSKGRSKKRKREANIADEDFDKRLEKLVQASRSGGSMPRGDQYRHLNTPPPQPGTIRFEESTAAFLDNLVYGAPYKALVPSFRRSGWSGASDVADSFAAFLKLPRSKDTGERAQSLKSQGARYFDREHRRKAQEYPELLMVHQDVNSRRRGDKLDGIDVSSSCNDEEEMTMTNYMHARTERLSRQTREHTHDISAWLRYTQHQQDLLLMSGGRVHPASLAAKQQAVLRTAMSHMPHSAELLAALACHVVRDLKDEEEEPDQVKYHMAQLRKLTRQYPASRLLWKELCGLMFQQGSGYTVSDARACCVDAVRALSKHAERLRITTASNGGAVGSGQAAAGGEVWQAECAAVEAIVRQLELELCSGHISEALMLLRCVCEWCSCPRESWTQPHRLRWFRAFFESDVGLAGAKGAPGFTTWVDRQTVSWLPVADTADSPSDSDPEQEEPQKLASLDVEMDALDTERAEDDDPEAEAGSEGEEMDEIDLLMLQERLGLEVEQQLEHLEAKGLSSSDLQRLLSLERQRCCNDAGLKVAQDEEDQEDTDAQPPEDVAVQYEKVKHVLCWLTSQARILTIRCCLLCIDIQTTSLAGPFIPSLMPQFGQLADDFHNLSRPMLLGEALGVMFPPYPSTTCAADMAQCPVWLSFSTFESSVPLESGTAGEGGFNGGHGAQEQRIPWFARSSSRHQLAIRILRQLLGPSSILQDNTALVRSLLNAESCRKMMPDGQLESEAQAGKRAYNAAKKWLSGHTDSLEVWTSFAALEARRGRYGQAKQALGTAMNGSVSNDVSKQCCRWPLALSAVLIELAACSVPLHTSTCWSRSGWDAVMHASRKCMHVLLWAAGGKGKARFVPLDKAMSPAAIEKEAETWQQRVQMAQMSFQSEIPGFLEVLRGSMKQGLDSSQHEAASAGILCALAFEVLGGVCQLLPPRGWERAVRLFTHAMDSMPDNAPFQRAECHSWACMICTLGALDRTANPACRHDLQLKLVRVFPGSSYLGHQLAVMQHSTCLQGRLRWSISLLQRTAGPAAHPNLYMCSLIDLWRRQSTVSSIKSRFEWLLSLFSSQGGVRPRHKNTMGTVDALEQLSSATQSVPSVRGIGKSGLISPFALDCVKLKWLSGSTASYDFFDLNQMPVFWMSFLSVVNGDEDSSAAYGLFYRSVNACGLCKSVWLKGLSALSESMKGTEISTLLDTMMGREIPLRTLPAEVLLEQLEAGTNVNGS